MWLLTDEERELREHIRAVVLEQVRPRVREMDENCDYPHDVHATLAREGLMGLRCRRSAAAATRRRPRGAPQGTSASPITRYALRLYASPMWLPVTSTLRAYGTVHASHHTTPSPRE